MPVRKILLLILPLLAVTATVSKGGDSLELKKSTLLYRGNLNTFGSDTKSLLDVNETSETKARFQKLRYSGYSRLWMFYRDLDKAYDDVPLEGLSIPVTLTQDDGANEPLLLVRLEANPTPKTWFQMEWMFDNRFLRTTTQTDANGNAAKVYRIFQFKGSTYTNFGTFKLTAGGGVNWFKLSPFTMWNYQYRDDLFERYPWEPEGSNWGRYDSFYSLGDIPRDQRWGNRGTQGFILEGEGLPGGFNAAILYGKNENSGGFQSYLSKVPQNMISGRIDKRVASHTIGVNFFDQYGFSDNYANREILNIGGENYKVNTNHTSQKIITADARINLNGLKIFSEIGAGSYVGDNYFNTEDTLKAGAKTLESDSSYVNKYKRDWSPLLYVEFETARDLTKLPIKVGIYNVGKGAVNNTSTIFNTSIESIRQGPTQGQVNNTTYFDGMVNQIGQIPNNRRGVNLKTNGKASGLKYEIGYETSQEIENLYGDTRNGARGGETSADDVKKGFTNSITFLHQANQLARSRFGYFSRFAGNYGREHNIYRRSFTNLVITDTSVNYKKSFTTMDLTLKYKFRFIKKELLLAVYTQYSSVSESPFAPKFNEDAFLRYNYVELMAFYALHPKVTLLAFGALEGAQGNMRTELADDDGQLITDIDGVPVYDATGKPMNQSGYGFGVGCDYDFASRASLHYRHRWYNHEDANFVDDTFKGQEVTIELKVFF